jgi:hypothetical protein
LAETETLLLLAVRAGLLSEMQAAPAINMAENLGRQLNVLRQRLSGSRAQSGADLDDPNPQSPIPNP